MKKQLFVLMIVGLSGLSWARAQPAPAKTAADIAPFDAAFKVNSDQRIYCYTLKYFSSNGKKKTPTISDGKLLSSEALTKAGLILPEGKWYAFEKFHFDKAKDFTGYLLATSQEGFEQRTIKLVVFQKSSGMWAFMMDVATFTHMESTMKQTRNSWIQDLDNDGNLDIATVETLQDYELPIESNISGTKKFMHFFSKGNLLYSYWREGLIETAGLKE